MNQYEAAALVDAATNRRIAELQAALWQAEAERDAAWQTCVQLAAVLQNTGWPNGLWLDDNYYDPPHYYCPWCNARSATVAEARHAATCPAVAALALVRPDCGHPIAAITGDPARSDTWYCRACAAQEQR